MPSNRKRRQPDFRTLAIQLATVAIPADPPSLSDALEDPRGNSLWNRLVDPGGSFTKQVGNDFRRFHALLPEAVRKDFIRYHDGFYEHEQDVMTAAYLVGFEVGRRMRGVA
jgi:hypothetical protein